ncbi:hypothetical protein AJ85_20540 [Alkalihalobacillus alcalophilus ATCC 27647 = CGMCC 1.3604]|uniref:Small, acid-soluble spore protein N n=1 Tax=Alkalihalobacillus alcalophilus ATCC 27647 = CGMCC 1.3604 TaxID=1218173 RepID=A0A094WMB5_ALKAL|nr:hypothetical protein [Alkalihalobacillus alcalophilus]KGA98889.1 hypothetical protein BALCAV_0202085 [Alkalihalobacillus alcalophilus ATCC 27647 = CGMCC 1.3604]MED1560527.1 hypothetical protein [Alkalihalobacillus alcalophilus]THG88919.1 hypothetical protein AJ85_20540 [Alkalihalobacillus alcalophilus ATCC 27647 = CGMCC 1.3604]
MPYQKDKQQAFHAAQQAFLQAEEAVGHIEVHAPEYGRNLKRAHKEIEEATQQIDKALGVASEHQKRQLEQFQEQLEGFTSSIE